MQQLFKCNGGPRFFLKASLCLWLDSSIGNLGGHTTFYGLAVVKREILS
ncbi:hypothetical protein PAMC26510_06305 [Caballeronia sordidicola]|uniref:Uncharacterized protein n=1 Tax=Caballeronia sordidicola TaxID=196367 RepID=A0A242N5W7_CABSO|nr:hypothetical protein PAMC26510_06305 [Caballeronia sordidicola]